MSELISHSQLQKEIQKVNFRKKSANDHNLFVDEDEELENVESLREIIIELSNEYEDLKVKYQKLLDLYYEKEKTLMEIKEKHNIKEDELLNKILQYEAQIRTLNEKIIDKDYQELNVNYIIIVITVFAFKNILSRYLNHSILISRLVHFFIYI